MKYDNYKVVCVDDDLDVLGVSKDIVESLGYVAITFSKAEEAVPYIKKNKSTIMIILSDLRMDNVNGFAFKKLLIENGADLPFVIITGYWTKEMSAEAMSLGVDAFVEKPVTADIFKEYIEKFGHPRAEMLEDEKEMVQGFLEESTPMLDEIESLILELEEDPSSDKTLSVYFRLLHTIKGTASCVGLTNLGNYTHKYEDFIGDLRTKKIPVNTASTNVLLTGLDYLKKFFTQIENEGNDAGIQYEDKLSSFDPANIKESADVVVTKEQNSSTPKAVRKTEEKKEDDKMTVSMSILNDFMEESGELTVIRNSILKLVKKIEGKYRGDNDVEMLNDMLGSMHHVTSNIQGKITDMRQVPLKSTFRPFKRLVRDLSKKLNKQVEFEVEGEDVSVDNIIAKLYSNTLIHIVRNSLDHGLETPEERVASGKSEVGQLKFKVSQTGEDIILQIVDDGKGVNPDFISAKAVEKGLYTEEQLAQMSELEIVNIIFDSGFSTAEQVSDLSGRGVGMDMVRGSFEAMGGEIYVKSEVGKGSTFNLKVPVPKSVLIITSLLVTCRNSHFIFQMDDVAEVIRYEKELPHSKLYVMDDKKVICHNDEMIQIIPLSNVLGLESDQEFSETTNIVVLRVGKSKYGIEVDHIHEFEEVVSRKIPEEINHKGIYMGASLLGSGEVSMILDAKGIAEYSQIELDLSNKTTLQDVQSEEIHTEAHEYMLFKYDEENYLSIELDYVDRLETMNTSNFEKVGNNTIIKYLNKPLRLVDPAHKLSLKTDDKLESLNPNEDVSVIVVTGGSGEQFGVVVEKLDEIQYSYEQMNQDTIDVLGLKGSIYLKEKTICVIDVEVLSTLMHNKIMLDEDISEDSITFDYKSAA